MKKIDEKTNIIGIWKGTVKDLICPFQTGGDIVRARKIAPMYIKYCHIFNIRADIAFAQGPCHETGKLTFKGIAKPEWNNFAGLGITGAGAKQTFASEDLGVLAHIVHLAWYVYPGHMHSLCSRKIDPRHFSTATKQHPRYNGNTTLGNLSGQWAVPGRYKQPDGSWITYDQKIAKYANIINNDSTTVVEPEIAKPPIVNYTPALVKKTYIRPPWLAPPVINKTLDLLVQMGHVGRTRGCTGANGEQEFNQKLGDAMALLLKSSGLKYRIMNADIWEKPEPNKVRIFLSLHYDGSSNKAARGYSLGFKPDSNEKFKEALAVSYGKLCGFKRRRDNYTAGLRNYYAWTLKRTRTVHHVDAQWYALLEHGFGSNDIERNWMFANIDKIAKHHVDLIVRFLQDEQKTQ